MSRRSVSRAFIPAVIMLAAVLATACQSVRVEVSQDENLAAALDLGRYASFSIEPLAIADDALAADGEGAEALKAALAAGLRARGLDRAASAGLSARLSVAKESSSRRRLSSDPGSNYYEQRDVTEAVLVLHLVDRAQGAELWRGEARAILPRTGSSSSARHVAVWQDAAEALVDRLPER